MTEITLIRHGQASFDSADYDRLSPLGHQQASWLGEYFAERDRVFDRIVMGDMRRHRETAESLCRSLGQSLACDTHAGLNEYDFQPLMDCYGRYFPAEQVSRSDGRRRFYATMRKALYAWANDDIADPGLEPWSAFEQRVRAALSDATRQPDARVLVVSSGGAISVALKLYLQLRPDVAINLNMQMMNTAFSTLHITRNTHYLLNFNSIPHLDTVARREHITHS